MLENLIAEALGILATVFLVDRIIKYREEKRILPVKKLINGKIFSLVTHFIEGCTRFSLYEEQDYWYRFGIEKRVRSKSYINIKDSKFTEAVKFEIDLARTTKREPSSVQTIIKAQQSLLLILDISITVIEPELTSLLMEYDDLMAEALESLQTEHEEGFKDVPAHLVAKAVFIAIRIHGYLDQKADEKITDKESKERIYAELQEINKKLEFANKIGAVVLEDVNRVLEERAKILEKQLTKPMDKSKKSS